MRERSCRSSRVPVSDRYGTRVQSSAIWTLIDSVVVRGVGSVERYIHAYITAPRVYLKRSCGKTDDTLYLILTNVNHITPREMVFVKIDIRQKGVCRCGCVQVIAALLQDSVGHGQKNIGETQIQSRAYDASGIKNQSVAQQVNGKHFFVQ